MADDWGRGSRDPSRRSPLQQGEHEARPGGGDGREEGRGADPAGSVSMGAEVRGADGGFLGRLAATWTTYVLVEPSPGAPTGYWVPVDAFGGYEGEALVLTVPRAEADRRGWAARPAGGPDRPR